MFDPYSYTIIASIFPRLLGIIYLFAFGAFLFQIKGLIGVSGILPLKNFISIVNRHYGKRRYYLAPMIFWLNSSDKMILSVIVIGVILSIGLMFGFMPPLMLGLLYFLYLSIVTGGQDFLSFGWEGFLLETTVHAFVLSWSTIPNPVIWFSLNFLLFRFHFYAGLVKFQSRDPNWRNLKALTFHYQTQPIPNTIAWYMHKLPVKVQEISCVFMFIVELIVPFGIFMTEEIRLFVCVAFLALQFFIWVSGNFSYLNHLTVVLSLILLNNSSLTYLFGLQSPTLEPTPIWKFGIESFLGALLCALQIMRAWLQILPNSFFYRVLQNLAPFHLANRYGIFAVMTTKRHEIIIEGSEDGKVWKEYTFKYKPSETSRRPRRISPYQPRIDWQVWFLPFSHFESETWFQNLLSHLLKGTPCVLKLLRGNPFLGEPPKYIRALIYDYTFSSSEEKKATGEWWHRKYIGKYTPILTLNRD